MLFNCFSCGKMISTKKGTCPYCRTQVSAAMQEMLLQRNHISLKERYKGTILALVMR